MKSHKIPVFSHHSVSKFFTAAACLYPAKYANRYSPYSHQKRLLKQNKKLHLNGKILIHRPLHQNTENQTLFKASKKFQFVLPRCTSADI